jgi:2-polyprenyl-3-methyl-5-hydroxy-6-metoxy-1,4-benzoquinol methylase
MKTTDDFNWDTYTANYYEPEMDNIISKDHSMLVSKSYIDASGHGVFKDNLHPNWKEVYHQVIKSEATSVLEVGCGPGQHLINLYKLNPNLELFGFEYSQSQIDLGYKHFNLQDYPFKDNLKVKDFSLDVGEPTSRYDLVFTQAVTMHLAYSKASKFISNMGKLAKSRIVMIENVNSHNYDNLLKEALPAFQRVKDSKYVSTVFVMERIKY